MEILDELEGRRGLLEQIDNGVRLKFDRECRDPASFRLKNSIAALVAALAMAGRVRIATRLCFRS